MRIVLRRSTASAGLLTALVSLLVFGIGHARAASTFAWPSSVSGQTISGTWEEDYATDPDTRCTTTERHTFSIGSLKLKPDPLSGSAPSGNYVLDTAANESATGVYDQVCPSSSVHCTASQNGPVTVSVAALPPGTTGRTGVVIQAPATWTCNGTYGGVGPRDVLLSESDSVVVGNLPDGTVQLVADWDARKTTPDGNTEIFNFRGTFVGASEYKLGFYSSGQHGAVRFTFPDGHSLSYGKYATGNYNDALFQAAAILGRVTGMLRDDSGTKWDWRITYNVTKAQFDAALKAAQNVGNYYSYNLEAANCVEYIQTVAVAAGISLPDFTDLNAPLLGAANVFTRVPDGNGMSASLQDIYYSGGASFKGGTVTRSDGTTIGNAPDPPQPPDPGSGGLLLRAAAANPRATASTYLYQYQQLQLTKANLGTGHTLQLVEKPSGDRTSMTETAIDWGDGSPLEYTLQARPGVTSRFGHTYSRPGSYTDTLVLLEDGTLVRWRGRVIVGHRGNGSQRFVVPRPGPLVLYTAQFPGAAQAIQNVLLAQVKPSGDAARISRLLAAGGYPLSLRAPVGGKLSINWYAHLQGQRVLIASTSTRSVSAGTNHPKIVLTHAGRTALTRANQLGLTVQLSFTTTGLSPIIGQIPATLRG